MLRRVALVRTYVAEELSASIIRVTRILAVTSNRRLPILVNLMTQGLRSTETSVLARAKRRTSQKTPFLQFALQFSRMHAKRLADLVLLGLSNYIWPTVRETPLMSQTVGGCFWTTGAWSSLAPHHSSHGLQITWGFKVTTRLHAVRSCVKTSLMWRIPSSGMWRRVALVRTDITEERNASIIRVTRIGEIGQR
jgi:hypothetical protein